MVIKCKVDNGKLFFTFLERVDSDIQCRNVINMTRQAELCGDYHIPDFDYEYLQKLLDKDPYFGR